MNRIELKERAKKLISGNLWYLLKPLVIFSLIIFAIGFGIGFVCGLAGIDQETLNKIISVCSFVSSFIEAVFMIGYAKYCIDFVRGNNPEWKDAIKFAKEHFGVCFVVSILASLIIAGWTLLLVIPGIIATYALFFYQEVCADNPDLSATEIIKLTWKITKGHRADLFVLSLSFIGWILLTPLTLGILMIWLFPYMTITTILAYEELKNVD